MASPSPSRTAPLTPASRATAASPRDTPEQVELNSVQNAGANASVPLQEDIMQCARLGEIGLIKQMIESGKYSAQYTDEEGITPLHWAAINNQYATCKYLIDLGANVNAIGGESLASPAMWAARRCHYYIVNLLMQNGSDPLLVDGQGWNILHLATIDGNSFLLTLLLHQNIPVDVTDPEGHTSLMWAAYKGFPACVDLLLRWGANVNATDEKGLAPLHWALVKGSQPCIQKMLEYGADRFAATSEGKTPATVAQDMKSTRVWHRALAEHGYDADGKPKILPLGLTSLLKNKSVMAKFYFLWPFLIICVVIFLMSKFIIWIGVPFAFIASFCMQWMASQVALWGPSDYRNLHRTPFLAGVFAGTLFWVDTRWLFTIFPSTFAKYPVVNIFFALFSSLTAYFYCLAMTEDPGFVPKLSSRTQQRAVMEGLFSLWKFDEDNFCLQCMIRKPLRSKHCRRCGRCVAKHDHHCPWINNCVGANNQRHFLVYIFCLEAGIVLFVRLVLAHIELLPTPADLECHILRPALCDIVLRDPWTLVLTLWAALQLIWVTMLVVVQLVQISKNRTTFENMKRHSFNHGHGGHGRAHPHPAGRATGTNPNFSDPAAAGLPPRREGCFARWKKLLGLDAFLLTAQDGIAADRSRQDRQNPFSRGVITNCRDFWCDSAPLFRKRTSGMGMLDGEAVNYTNMYEVPLRRTGRGDMMYTGLAGDGGGGMGDDDGEAV